MHSFSKRYLNNLTLSPATSWLLSLCAEEKGKEEFWSKAKPEMLKALRELAIVQSSESSNRIEGVTIEKGRLLPLLNKKVRPRDRSEEEVLGYRKALDWIHKNYEKAVIEPQTVQKLHALSQSGLTGDAGEWKKKNNEIIEILPNGRRAIRFVPVAPKETPAAMKELCLGYRHVLQQEHFPDLVAVFGFVFDFLCVHPFRDGNGRVSRLLTLLLLYQHAYHVGRYVSLERLVESSKENYYDVLRRSSAGWHDGKHDLMPFLHYSLGVIRDAYGELRERASAFEAVGGGKSDLIRAAILSHEDIFALQDIALEVKGVSTQLVKKILSDLKAEGRIKLAGRGRGARWSVRRGRD